MIKGCDLTGQVIWWCDMRVSRALSWVELHPWAQQRREGETSLHNSLKLDRSQHSWKSFYVFTENVRHTTVLCLLGRKTLTIGFWGERGLALVASVGVCKTAKLFGAEGKTWAPPPTPQRPILTSRRAGIGEGEQEKSVPLPMASSSCCSLCCRASSLLVYSS